MPQIATILENKLSELFHEFVTIIKRFHIHVERQLKTARRNCIHLKQFKDQWQHSFATRRKQMFSLTPLN